MTAIRNLLSGLIDYAGLFPPAGLSMEDAVRNYHQYISSEQRWMLGRFILPAGRLDEYGDALRAAKIDACHWHLSILATPSDTEAIARHNADCRRCGEIDVLEIKANNAREIEDAARVFDRYQMYFEVPPERWASLLPVIGAARGRAKVRTGGELPSAIPEETRVLEFLRIARLRRLAFKATAGLHHPIRGQQRLTYREDSPSAVMHGFLNVFCAASLLWHEPDRSQEAAWMLSEREPEAITMDRDTMTWHNSGITLTAAQIQQARQHFCISFGSCSFAEPVEDLRTLGWL